MKFFQLDVRTFYSELYKKQGTKTEKRLSQLPSKLQIATSHGK